MQEIYFLARHTPFWAIPLIVLGAEFAYLFWLRKKKSTVVVCLIIAFIGFMATTFYVWAGGPEKTVKIIKVWHRDYFQSRPGAARP
jgi:nucleoside recognition membrane protein YjiH